MNTTRLTPLGKLLLIVLVLTIGAIAGAAAASATRPHARDWRCVSVRPGDTLWDLAKATTDGDPRAGVDRIARHNGLVGAQIVPGTALWVPRDAGGVGTGLVWSAACAEV